jgi:TolA-binding protein
MNHCRGQLLQRVRRGIASDQERTAFEAHLGTCESCRLTLDIGDDFDQVGVADSEDAERVARLAAIARRTHERPVTPQAAPRVSRRFVWPLAAAALVLAGAAVAGGVSWRTPDATEAQPDEPAPAVAPSTTLPVQPTKTPEQPPASAPVADELPTRRSPPPARITAPPPTADVLYRLANKARRGGQTTQAIARYQELQQSFPGSAEARLSHVSLGRLLLQSGAAEAALTQFDAYLAGGRGQRLAAEALFGRGQALQALGRSAEEVQNWRTLIGQYPDSAYATHANRRIEALQ